MATEAAPDSYLRSKLFTLDRTVQAELAHQLQRIT